MKVESTLYKLLLSTFCLFFISIETPIGGITIDRILVLILFGIAFLNIKKFCAVTVLVILSMIWVTLSKVFTGYEEVSKYNMHMLCMGCLFVSIKIGEKDINPHKAFTLSFIFIVIVSVIALINFIISGEVYTRFGFIDNIPFLRASEYEHYQTVSKSYNFPRLSLPYPTPPQLSIVLAIYSFIFFFLFRKSINRNLNLILFIVSSLLLAGTLSRTGIMALAFAIILFLLIDKGKGLKNIIWVFTILFIVYNLLIYISKDFMGLILGRFSVESFLEGHMDARIFSINYFNNLSPILKIVGNGIGNFPSVHSHSTFLTILVELGIFGLFLYISIFFLRLKKCIQMIKKYKKNAILHGYELCVICLITMGFLFYDLTYVLPIYMVLGLAISNSYKEESNLKKYG